MAALGIGLGIGAPAPQGGIDLPLLLLAALVVLALNAAWYIVRWPWRGTAQPDRLARTLDPKEVRLFTPVPMLPPADMPASTGTSSAPADAPPALAPAAAHAAAADHELTAVPWPLTPAAATRQTPAASDQPPLGYLLRVTSDPSLPHTLPIPAPARGEGQPSPIRIGRHRQYNTVVIGAKNVSRAHALIVQKEGRLYLRDNASSGGTYLNWRRLRPGEELLLRHIDIVGFGEVLYKLHLGAI